MESSFSFTFFSRIAFFSRNCLKPLFLLYSALLKGFCPPWYSVPCNWGMDGDEPLITATIKTSIKKKNMTRQMRKIHLNRSHRRGLAAWNTCVVLAIARKAILFNGRGKMKAHKNCLKEEAPVETGAVYQN